MTKHVNPYDRVLNDVLRGKADLKCLIWYKNKRVLEEELRFPKKTYQDMYDEFIVKEVKSICVTVILTVNQFKCNSTGEFRS